MDNGVLSSQKYDPHILYNALNITAELKYKVPVKRVYSILKVVSEKSNTKITAQEVSSILEKLGSNLENTDLPDETNDASTLQEKIKELLRILGCNLSDKELNQILKGELSLDNVLSKEAKLVWLMIFDVDKNGKYRPNSEMAENLLLSAQQIAIQNLDMQINKIIAESRDRQLLINQRNIEALRLGENIKTLYTEEKKRQEEERDPRKLEEKQRKLRLYLAHMQGYDRDRDGDGSRGIDPTTGYVIDFDDVYIADKIYSGAVIEDLQNDGIDIEDIK